MKPWLLIIAGLALAVCNPRLSLTVSIPWPVIVAPAEKVTAAVYVYEKDSSAVPSGVMVGINRLNREKGIVATLFEDDSTDGSGDVPDQYREPLRAAREAGLPSLVMMSGSKVAKVLKSPKTAEEIMEAAK